MEHLHTYTVPQSVSRAVELAEGVASLELLRKIDRTVDSLVTDASSFANDTRLLHAIADEIKGEPVTKGIYLDEAGDAVDILARAEEHLKNYIPQMVLRRRAIDTDSSLNTEHRESLHDAYEEWMFSASSLLEALKLVRHSIIGHDLDATDWEKQPRFSSVEDLIADLNK